MLGTADHTTILVSFKTLQVGLDHIDGVVEHDGAETSETSSDEIAQTLVLDIILECFLGLLKHDEPYSLVR